MCISYDELFQIEGMEKAVLIGGRQGCVNSIDGVQLLEKCSDKEICRMNSLAYVKGGAIEDAETDLLNMLEKMHHEHMAGMLLETGTYILSVPQSVIDFANKLKFPLIITPADSGNRDLYIQIAIRFYVRETDNISKEEFIRQCLYTECNGILLEKARYFGFVLNKSYIFLSLRSDGDKSDRIKQIKSAAEDGLEGFAAFLCLAEEKRVLVIIEAEREWLFSPAFNARLRYIRQQYGRLAEGDTISIGISRVYNEMSMIKKGMDEADKAVLLLKKNNRTDTSIRYDEIGIYRLFIDYKRDDELYEFVHEELESLINYDKQNNTDLLHTLEVYLACNQNISKTVETMYVHRNTIKYRISRIEEILGVDLNDVEVCLALNVALKIKWYLEK